MTIAEAVIPVKNNCHEKQDLLSLNQINLNSNLTKTLL